MTRLIHVASATLFAFAMVGATACGGKGGSASEPAPSSTASSTSTDPSTVFGALDVGADYKSWKKVNTETFLSKPHGKRFVDIHVNEVGYDAYLKKDELPVGTIIVKPSWAAKDGKPGDVEGPIFVMEKKAKGFDSEHNDWWYGFWWKEPTGSWKGKGGIYWRSPSAKVNYCWECHDDFTEEVGRPPRDKRTKPPEAPE